MRPRIRNALDLHDRFQLMTHIGGRVVRGRSVWRGRSWRGNSFWRGSWRGNV